MKQRIIVVFGSLIINDKILIFKKSKDSSDLPGFYELPSDKLHYGESLDDAAKRLFNESCGLNVEISNIYHSDSKIIEDETHVINIYYMLELSEGEKIQDIVLKDKYDDYLLTDLKMLVQLTNVSTSQRKYIRDDLRV